MLPKVKLFSAVSLDGKTEGFNINKELYFEVASEWDVDAVLMENKTVLSKFDTKTEGIRGKEANFGDSSTLLVVPDNDGQIRIWDEVLDAKFNGDVLVLCSRSTPLEYLDFLDDTNIKYMIVGYDQVDFGTALEELNTQFNIKSLRVDGRSLLNHALLRDDLVDEISLLIYPIMIGGKSNSFYSEVNSKSHPIDLRLVKMEEMKDEIILLEYRVMKYIF